MLNAVRQGFVEPMIMSGENDEYGEDDAIHMVSINVVLIYNSS
jgi:hypothetical protein